MASGESDNFMMAVYLSAKCPVYIAPAMDLDMYKHPSTNENLERLVSFGNVIIYPGTGELASGLEGKGRLAEPEDIIQFIEQDLKSKQPLFGKKILITAGPTHEALDPVRYLGNRSSGKMGFALAEKASEMGAEVTLISGPVSLPTPNPSIHRMDIQSAQELFESVKQQFESHDIVVMAAAVADYTPLTFSDSKIKKKEGDLSIPLKRTEDILAYLGQHKTNQILIGFALETDNEIENATFKIERKKLDFIVLNSLKDKGAGFAGDTNKVTLIDKYNNCFDFELKSKSEVALDILTHLTQHY
jgi:phosphopantothenoylcysteine decarboxylase/phosphopantothenate--cysteine ligase